MNVVFKRISVENFLSIADKILWELAGQGLVLIEGENKDSQAADSNGAGKSTLFEALVWCIWGKTVRGQTGDAVVNRKVGKNCSAFLEFEYDGVSYTILRCRKHEQKKNSLEFWCFAGNTSQDLTQGTMALTQEQIERVLGIDYGTFIRGPMMPQGSFKKFSEMTDSEVKQVLEQALQIEQLAEAQRNAKQAISEVKLKQANLTSLMGAKVMDLEYAKSRIVKYQQEDQEWEHSKARRLGGIAAEIKEQQEKRKKALEAATVLMGAGTDIDGAIEVLKQSVEDAQATVKEVQAMYNELHKKWEDKEEAHMMNVDLPIKGRQSAAERQRDELHKRIKKIEKLQGDCPTCERPIDASMKSAALSTLQQNELQPVLDELKAIKQELRQAYAVEKDIKVKRDESLTRAQSFVVGAQTKVEVFQRQVAEAEKARSAVALIDDSIEKYQDMLAKERQGVSPFKEMISNEQEEVVNQTKAIRRIRAQLGSCELNLKHLEFWEYGFGNKGLKSLILESVTPFMNQRGAHYAQQLSGGEIDIVFNTQTVLKSGEVREQFSVQVINENGADTYAGNSGGEKGRADLGINFVVSDVVSSRARKAFPQRFFDEPFEGLDESGVDAVMALLADMAVDAGSIFVITHQPGLKGLFDTTLTMVKRNGKSELRS